VCDSELNLEAEQIRCLTKNLVKFVDFTQYSCLIFVIISHGDSLSKIYGVDNEPVDLNDDLIGPFNACESLRGKPKLFFVQACRGRFKAQTVETDNKFDSLAGLIYQMNTVRASAKKTDFEKRSDFCDVLAVKATVEKYVTTNNVIQGSCFIQALCRVLDIYASKEIELEKLVNMVDNLVVNNYKCSQLDIINSLRKPFLFNTSESAAVVLKKSQINDAEIHQEFEKEQEMKERERILM
jgi:hypothetical protein